MALDLTLFPRGERHLTGCAWICAIGPQLWFHAALLMKCTIIIFRQVGHASGHQPKRPPGQYQHYSSQWEEGLVERQHMQDWAAAQVAREHPTLYKWQRLPL